MFAFKPEDNTRIVTKIEVIKLKEENVAVESVTVNEVKAILDLFSKLDNKKKELALAALTGMVLVAEADQKGGVML
jgi:CRISPR/Cas system-associated endonuclease Cas3-HD